jgi:hypothetical protein
LPLINNCCLIPFFKVSEGQEVGGQHRLFFFQFSIKRTPGIDWLFQTTIAADGKNERLLPQWRVLVRPTENV